MNKSDQIVIQIDKLSPSCMRFLIMNNLDKILINKNKITKSQIIDIIANIRDELDRFF